MTENLFSFSCKTNVDLYDPSNADTSKKEQEQQPLDCSFSYLSNGAMPSLVLFHEFKHFYRDGKEKTLFPQFTPSAEFPREWHLIGHQTAGHLCNYHYGLASFLQPKSVDVLQKMIQLQDMYIDTDISSHRLNFSTAVEYVNTMKSFFDVKCEFSYSGLEEAWYPIDLTVENWRALTDEPCPTATYQDDVEYVQQQKWGSGNSPFTLFNLPAFDEYANGWQLVILGANCD